MRHRGPDSGPVLGGPAHRREDVLGVDVEPAPQGLDGGAERARTPGGPGPFQDRSSREAIKAAVAVDNSGQLLSQRLWGPAPPLRHLPVVPLLGPDTLQPAGRDIRHDTDHMGRESPTVQAPQTVGQAQCRAHSDWRSTSGTAAVHSQGRSPRQLWAASRASWTTTIGSLYRHFQMRHWRATRVPLTRTRVKCPVVGGRYTDSSETAFGALRNAGL